MASHQRGSQRSRNQHEHHVSNGNAITVPPRPVVQAGEEDDTLLQSLLYHTHITLAHRAAPLTPPVLYRATAQSVRDHLIERWIDTELHYAQEDDKRVYYLSLEFLMGRTLLNAISNLGVQGPYSEVLKRLGYVLEETAEEEKDPGLGNGGLGRLAACFLDSLATLNYPAWGYGIRYKYGLFEQTIVENKQVEKPDYWLKNGNPWEIERINVQYPVRFYGSVTCSTSGGGVRFNWEGGELIIAVAYDTPIPGYGTYNTNTLRLWDSRPSEEFNLQAFNAGQHTVAVQARDRAEAISSVLYPNDNSDAGKELRLKQQFFFVSASLQDILVRYKATGRSLQELHTKVAVQLNDTHPTIAIPELMRLLLDEEHMEWNDAWSITTRTFAYTNHTILPEALEKWPVPLLEILLPRHLQIIYEINYRHLQAVKNKWGEDPERLGKMSIIEESYPKMVRMAILATVGSHTVNGVAEIHSDLVKTRLFPAFVELTPGKFQNKTNGVTPRRWIHIANPCLSQVISKWLETDRWISRLGLLHGLLRFSANVELQREWQNAKLQNKRRLANLIRRLVGVEVDERALFDVHIKRVHEYKRQLLNIFSVIHRLHTIKSSTASEVAAMVPRVVIFAGKAAPGYYLAKCIIHLINGVAEQVNNDPEVGDLLKVVFIPNYSVSIAEAVVPASDISQHISTAGMEASGTSNMKFAMNGGLIIGTMDGANVEIADVIGNANMFIFGARADETDSIRLAMKSHDVVMDDRLVQVFRLIESGMFGDVATFQPLLDSVLNGNDFYLLNHDWPSYIDEHVAVDHLFVNTSEWTRRCIISTAKMGRFSSDRTIEEYATDIWNLKTSPVSV